ncbi:hypothetical protein MK632_33565 [Rhizobium changzhiense]|uniref:hypothetical protein n=1 Tax=Rhizobium TaxID=379 RepID=UPI001F0C424F|nr:MULTISPECIES: hypothetical protein [Rhizobium]MCH4550635.1 hypothetical protein [Rhizobium changzhiense]MCW0020043.1 hypothetical protein [Rhizobium sp. BT-226]
MLHRDDLARFIAHFDAARQQAYEPAAPPDILAADDGLFTAELFRLTQSLQIAAVAGDAEIGHAVVARMIVDQMGDKRGLDLEHALEWRRAITWCLLASVGEHRSGALTTRSKEVGSACKRLKKRGVKISINTFGVEITDRLTADVTARMEGLVRHLGGTEVVQQVCALVSANDMLHDGMWLLGNRIPGIHSTSMPAFPVGWIYSLGLRFLRKRSRARKPAALWKSIVELAVDFAAALDCQRYSQFEEIDVHAAQVERVLRDSLLWRELFVLPQLPAVALRGLNDAFVALITDEDQSSLPWDVESAIREIDELLSRSLSDRPTLHPRHGAASRYPTLLKMGFGANGMVNPTYGNPIGGGNRNQSDFLFFDHGDETVLTMPAPFLREAFCLIVFTAIAKNLNSKRSSKLIGSIFEYTLATACKSKGDVVIGGAQYSDGKRKLEIDVGAREGNQVVFFETKAKSITAMARSGDLMAFFSDYTKSFLAMLKQLVRHDSSLRKGLTPLAGKEEDLDQLRSFKVAVSPLSYGPASDNMLGSSLVRSFLNVRLHPLEINDRNQKITDDFNKAFDDIRTLITDVVPIGADGKRDAFAYFIDVIWVDLGQALYAIDRAHSVAFAFKPIQYMTYLTRDFWTEAAFADIQGITAKYWRPVASS